MKNFKIQQCDLSDMFTLRDFAIECFNQSFAKLNSKQTMVAYTDEAFSIQTLEKEFKNNNSRFYFLYVEDILAGYFKLNIGDAQTDLWEQSGLEVQRLYVAKEFQNLKYGSKILDFALKKAAELGKSYVWLGVWEQNDRGIAFYKKNGFKQDGTHSFFMGVEEQFDLVMKKYISTL